MKIYNSQLTHQLTQLIQLIKPIKLTKLTQLLKLILLALLLAACGSGPAGPEPADMVAQIPVSTARPAIPTQTAAPTPTPLPPTATPVRAAASEAAQPVPALTETPPEPTETETPAPEPTATSTPTPAATATFIPAPNWLNHSGRTVDGLMYLGNPNAPVTLTDFSDFLWTTCRAYVLGVEPVIRERYVKTGQVMVIFAPVLNHFDGSVQSHQAAECAADQGRFWEFHDALFEHQDWLWGDRAALKQLAAEMGLDAAGFNACLDEQRYLERVLAQDQIRLNAGIRGQPVFFINGEIIIGYQPFEVFEAAIEAELAE